MGEPARRMLGDSTTPIDAAVMAIVDRGGSTAPPREGAL